MPTLVPLAETIDRMVSRLAAVAAVQVPVAEAAGLVCAEEAVVGEAVPACPTAMAEGWAVAATEVEGASAQSPVLLAQPPARVKPGDPLPSGADAVLPPGAITCSGGIAMALQSAAPGEGARLSGHDLAAGRRVVGAGDTVTPAHELALALAGVASIAVRRPVVRIDLAEAPVERWLTALVASLGGVRAAPSAPADLTVSGFGPDAAPPPAGLAILPGREAAVEHHAGGVTIMLGGRFDSAVGAALALLPPALARLAGAAGRPVRRRITGKVASQAGLAEVILLRAGPDGLEPVSVGDISLAGLLAATHAAIAPAESEGWPAGAEIPVLPLPGCREG
jgi:molybdopterin biosynthesis enzyme